MKNKRQGYLMMDALLGLFISGLAMILIGGGLHMMHQRRLQGEAELLGTRIAKEMQDELLLTHRLPKPREQGAVKVELTTAHIQIRFHQSVIKEVSLQ